MPRVPASVVLAVALCLVSASPSRAGQQRGTVDAGLVGTWTLEGMEQAVGSPQAARVQGPRGLLVIDGSGFVFEAATRDNRQRPTAAEAGLSEAQLTFATYTGLWGRLRTDTAQKRMTIAVEGAVHPNVMGREVSRAFTLEGDRLTLTSQPGEPHTRGITHWTWERVPEVDSLGPTYLKVVGFWRHIVEKRVNLTLKTETEARRAPSMIVYTPSGYVGVHFPPLNRKPFAADEPTDAEARDATRGYVGYFGSLNVYPGQVFHHILGSLSLSVGQTLKRFFDLSGDDVNLRFPVARNAQGQESTTLVTMKRLSGEATMRAPRGR